MVCIQTDPHFWRFAKRSAGEGIVWRLFIGESPTDVTHLAGC